jgi:hypothetical protein
MDAQALAVGAVCVASVVLVVVAAGLSGWCLYRLGVAIVEEEE